MNSLLLVLLLLFFTVTDIRTDDAIAVKRIGVDQHERDQFSVRFFLQQQL